MEAAGCQAPSVFSVGIRQSALPRAGRRGAVAGGAAAAVRVVGVANDPAIGAVGRVK